MSVKLVNFKYDEQACTLHSSCLVIASVLPRPDFINELFSWAAVSNLHHAGMWSTTLVAIMKNKCLLQLWHFTQTTMISKCSWMALSGFALDQVCYRAKSSDYKETLIGRCSQSASAEHMSGKNWNETMSFVALGDIRCRPTNSIAPRKRLQSPK